jgi:monoamine oxidase
MTTGFDIVIVGGGAAGIAATRRLGNSGLSTLLLEAPARLGGRAWTHEIGGFPLDLGCGWLHSADRNPWSRIADANGLAIDRREAAWGGQYADLGFPQDKQRAAKNAFAEWQVRLPTLVCTSDCAGDALPSDSEWNAYVRAICGFGSGVAPDHMSASDYLAYDRACTYRNWRVPAGYGTLIAGSSLSATAMRLTTPVQTIAENRNGLTITTPAGNVSARAVILTVSTNVLAGTSINLPMALEPWRDAASRLPLGNDEKLFIHIDGETPFMPETHLIGDPYDSRTCDFYIRPFGWPIIECYLGGDSARVIAQKGQVAGFNLAIEQLVKLMGSDIRSKLKPLAASDWSRFDRIGGAYSCALPGQSDARRGLAQPWEGRIFFAGEATHPHDFATAHGAYDSGMRAAEEVIAVLNGPDGRLRELAPACRLRQGHVMIRRGRAPAGNC